MCSVFLHRRMVLLYIVCLPSLACLLASVARWFVQLASPERVVATPPMGVQCCLVPNPAAVPKCRGSSIEARPCCRHHPCHLLPVSLSGVHEMWKGSQAPFVLSVLQTWARINRVFCALHGWPLLSPLDRCSFAAPWLGWKPVCGLSRQDGAKRWEERTGGCSLFAPSPKAPGPGRALGSPCCRAGGTCAGPLVFEVFACPPLTY